MTDEPIFTAVPWVTTLDGEVISGRTVSWSYPTSTPVELDGFDYREPTQQEIDEALAFIVHIRINEAGDLEVVNQ